MRPDPDNMEALIRRCAAAPFVMIGNDRDLFDARLLVDLGLVFVVDHVTIELTGAGAIMHHAFPETVGFQAYLLHVFPGARPRLQQCDDCGKPRYPGSAYCEEHIGRDVPAMCPKWISEDTRCHLTPDHPGPCQPTFPAGRSDGTGWRS